MRYSLLSAVLLLSGAAYAQQPASNPTFGREATGDRVTSEQPTIQEQAGPDQPPGDRTGGETTRGGGTGSRVPVERDQVTGTRIRRSDVAPAAGSARANRRPATAASPAQSAGAPSARVYPPCSRTVTDSCIQTNERRARAGR